MKSALLSLACTSFLFSTAALAQIQSARVEGTVVDSSKALVPAAKVSLVNSRSQLKLDAETDSTGFYVFPTVQPGFYTLGAEAPGFRKASITNLEVNIGVSLRQEIRL